MLDPASRLSGPVGGDWKKAAKKIKKLAGFSRILQNSTEVSHSCAVCCVASKWLRSVFFSLPCPPHL